jgi:hypothetical protein
VTIGSDRRLFDGEGNYPDLVVVTGATVSYAYSRDSAAQGTITAGSRLTLKRPTWVWSASGAPSEVITIERTPSGVLSSSLRGPDGKQYKVVGGPLRNDGASAYWQPIASVPHDPMAIDSVATTASIITIDYTSLGATDVVTFIVTPDETLAAAGFTVGASVGVQQTNLTVARKHELADYISWSGSAWTKALGASSPFTVGAMNGSGTLPITHASVGSAEPYGVSLVGRQGFYVPQVGTGGLSDIATNVEFFDFAGAKPVTPDTNMKFFLTRTCAAPVVVDPRTVDTVAFPNSNLWFLAVLKV